jgi:hypothetical protein
MSMISFPIFFFVNAVLKANATIPDKTTTSSTSMFDHQANEASPSGYVMSMSNSDVHLIPSQIIFIYVSSV